MSAWNRTRAYSSYAGKSGWPQGREDRNRPDTHQFPADDDSFTTTIPNLIGHMKKNPGKIHVRNLGHLVGLVSSRGLPLHSTAVHFSRSNMHRDGHVYIEGRSYAPRTTHSENFHRNGSIVLTPREYARGGEFLRVDGREFAPDEGISISSDMKLSLIDMSDNSEASSQHNQVVPGKTVTKTDLYGRFVLILNVPTVPRAMKGYLTVTATGTRSTKLSSKSIHVT